MIGCYPPKKKTSSTMLGETEAHSMIKIVFLAGVFHIMKIRWLDHLIFAVGMPVSYYIFHVLSHILKLTGVETRHSVYIYIYIAYPDQQNGYSYCMVLCHSKLNITFIWLAQLSEIIRDQQCNCNKMMIVYLCLLYQVDICLFESCISQNKDYCIFMTIWLKFVPGVQLTISQY